MSFLKYWDVSNLNGWAIPQKLPIKDLKWVEDVSEFDESYNKESYEEYFVEADFQYLKISVTMIYPFCQKK